MLTDINSDFGLEGQPFEVFGDAAIMNWLKNLFRHTPGSDRYEYIHSGLDLERFIKEPSSLVGADRIFLMITETLRYNLPQLQLDTSRSRVTPNLQSGDYDVLLYINNSAFEFSI